MATQEKLHHLPLKRIVMTNQVRQAMDGLFGKIEQNVEYDGWQWTYRDSYSAVWQNEYQHWFWDSDLPFIAVLPAEK